MLQLERHEEAMSEILGQQTAFFVALGCTDIKQVSSGFDEDGGYLFSGMTGLLPDGKTLHDVIRRPV